MVLVETARTFAAGENRNDVSVVAASMIVYCFVQLFLVFYCPQLCFVSLWFIVLVPAGLAGAHQKAGVAVQPPRQVEVELETVDALAQSSPFSFIAPMAPQEPQPEERLLER